MRYIKGDFFKKLDSNNYYYYYGNVKMVELKKFHLTTTGRKKSYLQKVNGLRITCAFIMHKTKFF